MKLKTWAALLMSLLLLSSGLAYGEDLKMLTTFLGPTVTVPQQVPDKPEGVAPFILLMGNMALVVYSVPESEEDIDYAEVFDLESATTVGIVWTKGGTLFLVQDEGLLKDSVPSGTFIFAPPSLRDTL